MKKKLDGVIAFRLKKEDKIQLIETAEDNDLGLSDLMQIIVRNYLEKRPAIEYKVVKIKR